MRMYRLALALFTSLVLFPAGITRADEPLSVLPADTAAVIRISSLDKFAGNFKEMVSALGPLANPAVEGIERGLSEMFKVGADGAALDRAAPSYLAAFALDGPEPLARIVKTADEARLRRTVLGAGADSELTSEKHESGFEKLSKDGRHWYFARRGEWVLYTEREEIAKALAFDAAQQPTLAKVFAGRAVELAADGDAAVLINLSRLIEVYGDKLDEQRDKLRRQIDNLPKEFLGGDSSAIDPRATKKMYSDLAELLINAVYDAEWAVARANFTAAGVTLAASIGIRGDTATNDFVTENPPTTFETLGLLPAGAPIYYGYSSYPPSLVDWRRDWLKLAYGDDTEVTKKLLEALEASLAAEATTTVGSLAFPSGVDTCLTTVTLTQANDPEKLRGSVTVYEPAANKQDTPLFSQSVDVTANVETYQDRAVDLMTTRFKFKEVADPGQAIGQKFMQKLFGGDEVETRLTTLEGVLIEAGGNDPKYLRGAVDRLQSGENVLGLNESYAITRDQLPEKANAILLLDAPRLIVDLIGIFKTIPPLDMFLAQAPLNLGAQPATSYAGISLATQPQGLRLEAYLPVTQPQGVLRIFGQ
jgi:hypothetical protein